MHQTFNMIEPCNAPTLPVLDSIYYKYLFGHSQSTCSSVIKDLPLAQAVPTPTFGSIYSTGSYFTQTPTL